MQRNMVADGGITSICEGGNPVSWLLQSRSCDISDVRTTTRTKILDPRSQTLLLVRPSPKDTSLEYPFRQNLLDVNYVPDVC